MASKNPQNTKPDKETGGGSKSPSKKKMTPEEQSARFIETARELECDETDSNFLHLIEEVLAPYTPHKPSSKT